MVATIDQAKLPTDWQGRPQMPQFVRIVGNDGEDIAGGKVYQLASNSTLGTSAPTNATTPATGVQGGSYLWDVQLGAGTSVVLQALGSDGTTWRNVATATASGTVGVVIGQNATLRLFNPNGTADTGVYSSIS